VQKIYAEIKTMGAEVLVVSFTTPALITAFGADFPQPFPVVADPERKAYQAFALGATSLRGFLRPAVVWHYLTLMLRGWIPRGPGKDADIWQLGGDFIIDAAGRLRYAHPSHDAADRPSNAELRDALRQAGAC
jgi:peroxiredoxin